MKTKPKTTQPKTMKSIALHLLAALALTVPALAAGEHAHEKTAAGEHSHEKAAAGPNGGRVIKTVEPHLEFFVTKERKVQITALTEDLKARPLSGQVIAVLAGERSQPTKLEFQEEGGKLVSRNALPAGQDLPVSVSIKADAQAKAIYAKFNLNLAQCPSCQHQEYACICAHGSEEK